MADTKIEWTNKVWNPVTGCTKVSPGCDNCYAERLASGRFKAGYPHGFSEVTLHPERLFEPHRWRKPKQVFVCSMSDLFHPRVPFEFIHKIFAVMAACPQHTFQVLTKRPGRMAYFAEHVLKGAWPKNVWAGTSVESEKYLPRLDVLVRVPAPVRFVSAEPLLGPLDLQSWLAPICPSCSTAHLGPCDAKRPLLVAWVIVGGESGPNARPMHPDWVRGIRDQCQEAGVPFFFKQWGEFGPAEEPYPLEIDGDTVLGMKRVGKKAAGAVLDGREWKEMP